MKNFIKVVWIIVATLVVLSMIIFTIAPGF
ncbi:MAG: hypothetical protein UV65_C0039G0002 [Parcubacteria group bacterium GW2011_GWF2_43_11]|nr:MAG: hypothetical protein UV65_C0039G0002 [Parcubacteria group bacterium GW2011_GWF2_43_11]